MPDFTSHYASVRSGGASVDETIGNLLHAGATPEQCVEAVRVNEKATLAEARGMFFRSPARAKHSAEKSAVFNAMFPSRQAAGRETGATAELPAEPAGIAPGIVEQWDIDVPRAPHIGWPESRGWQPQWIVALVAGPAALWLFVRAVYSGNTAELVLGFVIALAGSYGILRPIRGVTDLTSKLGYRVRPWRWPIPVIASLASVYAVTLVVSIWYTSRNPDDVDFVQRASTSIFSFGPKQLSLSEGKYRVAVPAGIDFTCTVKYAANCRNFSMPGTPYAPRTRICTGHNDAADFYVAARDGPPEFREVQFPPPPHAMYPGWLLCENASARDMTRIEVRGQAGSQFTVTTPHGNGAGREFQKGFSWAVAYAIPKVAGTNTEELIAFARSLEPVPQP